MIKTKINVSSVSCLTTYVWKIFSICYVFVHCFVESVQTVYPHQGKNPKIAQYFSMVFYR